MTSGTLWDYHGENIAYLLLAYMLVQSHFEILSDPPEQLVDLIDMWLWGFSEPRNWPSPTDVRSMLAALIARPDSRHPLIREAIAMCLEYIRTTR